MHSWLGDLCCPHSACAHPSDAGPPHAVMGADDFSISEADLKEMMKAMDKDGDGKVTGKEWGSAVKKNKDVMSKYFGGKDLKSIGKAFSRIDADGSGDLTWEEFVEGSQRVVNAL